MCNHWSTPLPPPNFILIFLLLPSSHWVFSRSSRVEAMDREKGREHPNQGQRWNRVLVPLEMADSEGLLSLSNVSCHDTPQDTPTEPLWLHSVLGGTAFQLAHTYHLSENASSLLCLKLPCPVLGKVSRVATRMLHCIMHIWSPENKHQCFSQTLVTGIYQLLCLVDLGGKKHHLSLGFGWGQACPTMTVLGVEIMEKMVVCAGQEVSEPTMLTKTILCSISLALYIQIAKVH